MNMAIDEVVSRWAEIMGIDSRRLPAPWTLRSWFGPESLRPPADPHRLDAWEQRHGYQLPPGLRAWLSLSDGFYVNDSPWIHPIAALGPMVPFAQVPGLFIQPESWFELGNPDTETVCVDLAYTWPGADCPLFTSGDDLKRTSPQLIAPSFSAWFGRLLSEGGRAYWFDPHFVSLGNPWSEHRLRTPKPVLPDRLRMLLEPARQLVEAGVSDFDIAGSLAISRWDVEALCRYLQHAAPGEADTAASARSM